MAPATDGSLVMPPSFRYPASMTGARTLQGVWKELLAEFPRLLATRLLREKLEPFGCADDEELVEGLVVHLLAGDGRDSPDLGGEFEDRLPDDVVLQFDDDDMAKLEHAVAKFSDGLPELVRGSAEAAAEAMLRRYKRNWSEWRPHAVARMDGFKANLETRWGKGFDLIRMLIELSRDQGTAFHRRAKRSHRRSGRRAHLDTALSHLHSRALQIASEIMTLMENGFADGAMARWRTLHEVTCVAMVLNDGGDELAERYLAHEFVEAKKALGQYQQCQERLGYAPLSRRETTRIERDFDTVIARYGKDFGGDYGWIADRLGVARPNFRHVENAAGQAMMRSHYKMASNNVHAGVKGIAHRLSAFDPGYSAISVASNVGFVEPGQNLGMSLLHFTMLLLPKRWTLDGIALLNGLIALQGEIGPALARSERSISRDEHRIRKGRAASRALRTARATAVSDRKLP